MEIQFLEIIKEVGPYAAVMLFFIWRDYKREDRLERRVDTLNEFVRVELMDALEKTNTALVSISRDQATWKTPTSSDR